MEVEVVCEGLAFPEGPIAMADGSVVLVEVQGQRLTRVRLDGRKEVLAETGGGPNGAAVGPDGAIWIANNGGAFFYPDSYTGGYVQRYDLSSGELATVYEACDGQRLIAPNDLVFDAQGGLWFTDHGRPTAEGRIYGAVCHAAADGSVVTRQRPRLCSPNGIGLSPDERTLYVADTELGRLWAFEVTAPGVLAPQVGHFAVGRVVCALQDGLSLDSLAVEAGGKVCAAAIGQTGGGIAVFDPAASSAELVRIDEPICTNICFGGPDMRDAWITGSGTGRLYRCRWPRPGLKPNFNA
jgi:gluconolactonase